MRAAMSVREWVADALSGAIPSTAYQSSPCHIEFILTEGDAPVGRPDDDSSRRTVSKR